MNLNFAYQLHIFLMLDISRRVVGDVPKHSEECALILENFAAASARFMFCSLQNSRPIHICCSCIEEYNEALDKHDKILETKHKENSTCKELLINQDRLEVIESGYSYIKDLWTKGQCQNCLKNKSSLSDTTKKFVSLYADTSHCLESHYDPINKHYNPDVCFLCTQEYYKMSKFYFNLKETSGNGNVCMDIVDTVNVTQHLWSNILHCGETVMTFELPLTILATTFCSLPIFFYLCAWKFAKSRSTDVYNQNRVSQRFRERWRSQGGSFVSN